MSIHLNDITKQALLERGLEVTGTRNTTAKNPRDIEKPVGTLILDSDAWYHSHLSKNDVMLDDVDMRDNIQEAFNDYFTKKGLDKKDYHRFTLWSYEFASTTLDTEKEDSEGFKAGFAIVPVADYPSEDGRKLAQQDLNEELSLLYKWCKGYIVDIVIRTKSGEVLAKFDEVYASDVGKTVNKFLNI